MHIQRHGFYHHAPARQVIENHPLTLILLMLALFAFALT